MVQVDSFASESLNLAKISKMKRIYITLLALISLLSGYAQKDLLDNRPKLVVGVVVDQMRYDYLTRFYDHYGEGGFKRLLGEGFNFQNAHFNYIPTKTAVGHASIYTGTTPSNHGILGNNWYDRDMKQWIYCVDDASYSPIGTEAAGEQKSPYRLKTTTLADELRMAQNMNGKTISLSLKDRSAILPGGHTANAAYWFRGSSEGKFISSSFYMDQLPDWVNEFNASGKAASYMEKVWEPLLPIADYKESMADDNPYESAFAGQEKPVFPYDLKVLGAQNGQFEILKSTPFGNSLLVDFTKAAIRGEQLGKRGYVDFLAVSFSSPDYVGHKFGVDSKEVQDVYIRLDKDMEELLDFLDQEIGADQYTLFLTSDHGVVRVPSYLQSLKIPAGYFDSSGFRAFLDTYSKETFGSSELIESFSNYQIFLNKDVLEDLKLSKREVTDKLVDTIIDFEGVHQVVSAHTMQRTYFKEGLLHRLQQGYNQKLSGDVLVVPNPGVISASYGKTGTNHGSGFVYDTHVPVIFFGKGVRQGSSKERAEIIDIAPTLSNLLQISFPNASDGKVLHEALR